MAVHSLSKHLLSAFRVSGTVSGSGLLTGIIYGRQRRVGLSGIVNHVTGCAVPAIIVGVGKPGSKEQARASHLGLSDTATLSLVLSQ